MEYNRIVSVTGLTGLYELVASKTDGAIIRSLDDSSTKFVSSRVHNLSHLETIEVYTNQDNVNLVDVLNAMKASSEPLPSNTDAKAVKGYFEKVYPNIDFDRVYASDMKKIIKWFSVLQAHHIDFKLRDEESSAEETETDPVQTSDEAGEDVSFKK